MTIYDSHEQVTDFETLKKGDRILLVPNLSDAEEATPVHGVFLSHSQRNFSVALGGATTGVPFPKADWVLLVPRSYPVPEVSDIEALIFNAIEDSKRGEPRQITEIAESIAALMRQEITGPIGLRPFIPAASAEPEAADTMPDGAPRPDAG